MIIRWQAKKTNWKIPLCRDDGTHAILQPEARPRDEVKNPSAVYVAPRKVWPHPMWLCHHHHHRVPYIDNAHNSVTPSKMWWDSLRIQPTLGLIPALFQPLGNENLWFVDVSQSPVSELQLKSLWLDIFVVLVSVKVSQGYNQDWWLITG